ncbi:MAG: hypothetical protein R3Y39_05285 [Rikenellaceae bacterium]
MNREDRDWIDAIRESVEVADTPADDALWSRIEHTMDQKPAVVPLIKRLPIGWFVSGVAAAITVALFIFMPQEVTTSQEEMVAEETSEVKEMGDEPAQIIDNNIELMDDVAVMAMAEHKVNVTEVDVTEEVVTEVEVTEVTATQESPTPENTKDKESEPEQATTPPQPIRKIEYRERQSNRGVSLLYAGGLGANSSTNAPQMMAHCNLLAFRNPENVLFEDLYRGSEVIHHQPIGLGVRMERGLAGNLSWDSGLNYNLLLSDVNIIDDNKEEMKQQIHFVAIPIGLNYRFVSRDKFSLYVGTGASIEYCLRAKVDNMVIDERRWHYSADVNMGAEYMINSFMGLYFEPSVSHYFTTTRLKTIRNDSPTMFNMRLGLSFKL